MGTHPLACQDRSEPVEGPSDMQASVVDSAVFRDIFGTEAMRPARDVP